ncbi:MAG TPA: NAD(P)-dependent oxidoreductase [Gammaproteobacteria bacterium]|nr:NAD(P)-dependent oxidoreductase [Gammaproteobacteria bacterium]
MIILDRVLQQRQDEGRPIRVAMIGAGYMGRGLALQICRYTPGMELVAIANRTLSGAERAYREAGIASVQHVDSQSALEAVVHQGQYAVTDNAPLVCQADGIDAVIEVTGEIEFGAGLVLTAIEHGKHVMLMNAELDATLGPILKTRADQAGVVITNADGDQPGVIMNLFRYVEGIGCRPVLAGNMKGLQDAYRTPETQKGFAEKYGQKPHMVTSFADGSKISMEMAVVANATGFRVAKRGMLGPACEQVTDAVNVFPRERMLEGGLVDYVLGAQPGGGVFVIGYSEDNIQQGYLNYYKMGEGPFYVFYVPYHLCHFEAPMSIARAVLYGDATTAPLGAPVVEVLTAAKKDLKKGEVLDGIGRFSSYGLAENAEICSRENLLPLGLSEGCRLKRDVARDEVLSYDDVELPEGRISDRLREEQNARFPVDR